MRLRYYSVIVIMIQFFICLYVSVQNFQKAQALEIDEPPVSVVFMKAETKAKAFQAGKTQEEKTIAATAKTLITAMNNDQESTDANVPSEKRTVKVTKTPVKVIKDNSEKTYMDYRAITNKSSPQYKFIKDNMTVCDDGFLRDKHGNIGVALGSFFGEIGTTYEFVLDTGIVLNVVKIEEKDDRHTINGFYHKIDNSIIEFVVDSKSEALRKHVYSNGYIWSGNFNNCPSFEGRIKEIYKTVFEEVAEIENFDNRDNERDPSINKQRNKEKNK